MRIAGADLSSKTGFVVLDGKNVLQSDEFHFKATDKPDRFQRFKSYADEILLGCKKHDVSLVAIEGYAYAGKFVNSFQYEIGAVVRHCLWVAGTDWIEVSPKSLKKFTTGTGNAKKDLMLLEVYKKWGFDTKSDNVADAFALAKFGQAFTGALTGMPTRNKLAIQEVIKSHAKMAEKYGAAYI